MIDLQQLKDLKEKYLRTLDNKYRDEIYGNDFEIAEYELNAFLEWLSLEDLS